MKRSCPAQEDTCIFFYLELPWDTITYIFAISSSIFMTEFWLTKNCDIKRDPDQATRSRLWTSLSHLKILTRPFNEKQQELLLPLQQWVYNIQGPVVQSIVSLTRSLRGQLVKCFTTLLPNTLIFLLKKKKNERSFSHFFNKKYWLLLDISVWFCCFVVLRPR